MNGFLNNFIKKHQVLSFLNYEKIPTAEKKSVCINLRFYSDKQADHIANSVSAFFGKHVPTAGPVFLFSKARIPQASKKRQTASNFDNFHNRQQISLSSEQVLKWLREGRSTQWARKSASWIKLFMEKNIQGISMK